MKRTTATTSNDNRHDDSDLSQDGWDGDDDSDSRSEYSSSSSSSSVSISDSSEEEDHPAVYAKPSRNHAALLPMSVSASPSSGNLPSNNMRRRAAPPSRGNSFDSYGYNQHYGSEIESDLEDPLPNRKNYKEKQSPNRPNKYSRNNPQYHRHRQHRRHHRPKRRHHHSSRQHSSSNNLCVTIYYFCKHNQSTIRKQLPTLTLIGCFVFWLLVQTNNVFESVQQTTSGEFANKYGSGGKVGQPRTKGRPPPPSRVGGGFWADAVDGFFDLVGMPAQLLRAANNRGEALAPGCIRSAWQYLNLPNCNDLHEIDLYATYTQKVSGYVASGYWRHVWLVDPRYESPNAAVLKMMKLEHKVEPRNFERHRRDALAMERLSHSPQIIDIFGYCGNSVVTEYAGRDLHHVIYASSENIDNMPMKAHQNNQKSQQESRSTYDKLQLALQVAQGVAAIHQMEGDPIVHADIADKQFLINADGQVKLNDFNRCRFMGHKYLSGSSDTDHDNVEKCTFHIPSAPGRHRSPEEYEDSELTEQLDVFSTANVLYGILTETEPWNDLPSSQVKRAVKHNIKPTMDPSWRVEGTPEAAFADVIDQAYEHDPVKRITAPELVENIQQIIHVHYPTSNNNR